MTTGVQTAHRSERPIECLQCGAPIKGFPNIDHARRVCEFCQTDLFLYSTLDRDIVVDMERAPFELKEFVNWARSNLDAIEFMRLTMVLEEMLCPQSSQDAEHRDNQA